MPSGGETTPLERDVDRKVVNLRYFSDILFHVGDFTEKLSKLSKLSTFRAFDAVVVCRMLRRDGETRIYASFPIPDFQ